MQLSSSGKANIKFSIPSFGFIVVDFIIFAARYKRYKTYPNRLRGILRSYVVKHILCIFIYNCQTEIGYCKKEGGILYPIKNEGDKTYRVYGEITSLLEKYLDCVIIPVKPLIDFADNNFKSIEERRNQKNLRAAYIGIAAALLIGFKENIKQVFCSIWQCFIELVCPC